MLIKNKIKIMKMNQKVIQKKVIIMMKDMIHIYKDSHNNN